MAVPWRLWGRDYGTESLAEASADSGHTRVNRACGDAEGRCNLRGPEVIGGCPRCQIISA